MKKAILFLLSSLSLLSQVTVYPGGGGGGNSVTQPYTQTFTAVTSVVLTPGFATTGSITACYDNSNTEIILGANPGILSKVITSSTQITVTFQGGAQTGKCNVLAGIGPAGAAGTNGTNGTNGSPGMVWQGVWSGGTTYSLNDSVYYSGSSYISLTGGNLNNNPAVSPSSWSLVAQSGSGGAPASPTLSVQFNNAGSLGAVAIGAANRAFSVNGTGTGYNFPNVTMDTTGNVVAGGSVVASGATPVNCPTAAGCFGAFAGNIIYGTALPNSLTSSLWETPPNALPTTNAFKLFATPIGSGNTTQSLWQWYNFGSSITVTGNTVDVAASGVTPGTYGDTTHTPVVVVGADGRITGLSTVATSGSGSGVGNPYSTSFTCNSTPTSVLAATHSQGINPAINLYDSAKTPLFTDMTLNTSGDITITCPLATLTGVTIYVSGANGPDSNFAKSFGSSASDAITSDDHGILAPNLRIQAWDTAATKNLMLFTDLPTTDAYFKVTQTFKTAKAAYLILYR